MEQPPGEAPETPADSADSDEGFTEETRDHSQAAPAGEQEPKGGPGVADAFRSGS